MDKCKFVECEESPKATFKYCEYHKDGGAFNTGEFYDQYQIIEEDFINFLKVIPMSYNNPLELRSPVLRDVIIRSCIQIEIFFKEWAKYYISDNQESKLYKKYFETFSKSKKQKKEKGWKLDDYHCFSELLDNDFSAIEMMNFENEIRPFSGWRDSFSVPEWWEAYNTIKHSTGTNAKKVSTLINAINALGALFYIQCANRFTRNYLLNFSNQKIINEGFGRVSVEFQSISTPIDSKKYLFRVKDSYSTKKMKLVTGDRNSRIDRMKNRL